MRLRPDLGDQLDRFFRGCNDQTLGVCALARGPGTHRDHTQGRKARDHLSLLRSADCVVEPFEQERESHPGGQPEHKSKSEIPRYVGLDGRSGRASDIHDAEVVGAQPGGNAGFLQFLQQSLVELAVGVDVALEQAVFDRALVELIGFLFLLFERVMQHAFPLQGCQVPPMDLARDLFQFSLNLRVDFLKLVVQLG